MGAAIASRNDERGSGPTNPTRDPRMSGVRGSMSINAARRSRLVAGPLSMALLLVATGLSGCALVSATPPAVDVLDLHLTGIGLTEQQLAVTLCVTNPNADELTFRRVSVDFDVSGLPLAAGTSDLAVRLPPLSSVVVPFTVVTTVQNLGPQLLGVFRTGSLDYRVHGTVTLQGGLGLTLPYSRSGHLDPIATGLTFAINAADSTPSRCTAR